jgi:cell division protein FtsA
VGDDDIRGVVHEGQTRAMLEGRQSIHAIPLQFAADGTEDIDDPRGLFCDTLGARLHIVDAGATALRSLEACMARCDLEIEELVSAPMAAGLACLVDDERALGATVIDMGGGTTSIAVFADGHLQHTAQIGIGGQHVTKDLAAGLSTTLAHAERLKTLFGNVERSPDDAAEMLPVPLVGEEDDHQLARVPRSMVVNIIRPRVEETFEFVKAKLDAAGLTRGGPSQVVLTGGACQLPGLRDLAGHMLGRRVRIGRPQPIRGLPELASGPAFAVAAGMLTWADGQGRGFQDVRFDPPEPEGLLRRALKFIRERL